MQLSDPVVKYVPPQPHTMLQRFLSEPVAGDLGGNQVPGGGMGMRGGAVCHMSAISAGVRA